MSDFGSLEDIKIKIRQNVLKTEPKDCTRNQLWQHFLAITNEVDGEKAVIPYVACVECGSVLSYDSNKGGTSHLRRHVDGYSKRCSTSNPSVTSYFKHCGIPKSAKDTITRKCVEFVSKDIRPFTTVNGEGFLQLAQALINVGVKYGQVQATDVIPHRTTVSIHVSDLALQLKSDVVIPQIQNFVNVWGGGLTTDMWSDPYTQTSYICHYVNDEWQLIDRVLQTSEFDSSLHHTGQNIKQTLDGILASFHIDCNRVTFVTDRGANMLAALKDCNHIACSDHMLNTVLSTLFDSKNVADVPEVSSLLTGSKELVRFFKKSPGLMKLLTKSLKQEANTRWNSMHTMLCSLKESYTEVEHILEAKSECYRYVLLVL
jgi:hypothetical protein